MTKFIIILVVLLVLIYLSHLKEGFENSVLDDNLIIVVYSDGFYYLNIKNNESNRFDVYRIPLGLIKNFYK